MRLGPGADADRLVGVPQVQRVLVDLGVDGDGLDAELLAGADDPQGDLAPVRDENALEHRRAQAASSGLDQEERLVELDRLLILDEDLDDGPGHLRLDLVEDLHGLDQAEHGLGA